MSKAWKQKLLLLIQLLLLLQHSVDSGSVVTHLPGFDGPLPFHLETGYIGVGEGEKIQLFYYFVKSENNPKQDPLLIWLTGGPACSAFTALGYQNGPFTFKLDVYNGNLPSLIPTSFSWTKEASIIYLDQPVGTGFSYSKSLLDDLPSDIGEAKQTYEFLQKWLLEYPEFASNPLYVSGDSYSGVTVPAIVQEISLGNEHGQKPLLNLKGYILGNPGTNENDKDFDARIPYAHGMGLISDELFESIGRSCKGNYFDIDPTSSNKQCLKLMDDYDKCTSKLHIYNILVPSCGVASPNPYAEQRIRRRYLRKLVHSSEPIPTPDCYVYRFILGQYWANNEDVRKALHVVKGSIGIWERCKSIPYTKDIVSSVPYHRNNSIKGIYRSLIYSGDHDLFVPFVGTEAWIKSLNYSVIDEWRPWFANNQVLGYTRTYANNMTFVTVKGGGHTADYKADESFVMFKRWIRGQSL